jgi:tRNA (guanine10-N2)-dimethyltransferase
MSHFLCEEIGVFDVKTSLEEIVKPVLNLGFKDGLAFRVRRVRASMSPQDAMLLEAGLNKLAAGSPRILVDLENPKNTIDVIASDGFLIVGRRLCESDRRSILSRSGGSKPFFHPSSLNVGLARVMLNIARVRRGSVVLDPFSGTGTILVEAYCLGASPIGLDLDPRMVYSSLRNYRWFRAFSVCQMLADARSIPVRHVDAVVTDPPYGRRASTHGSESLMVYESFVREASRVVEEGGWVVFLAPSVMPVERLVEQNGFRLLETYFIEVHTGLTRKLLVARG